MGEIQEEAGGNGRDIYIYTCLLKYIHTYVYTYNGSISAS